MVIFDPPESYAVREFNILLLPILCCVSCSIHGLEQSATHSLFCILLCFQLVFQRDDYDIEVRTTSADVVARVSLDAASAALTPIIGQYVMGDIGAQVAMLREPE